MTTLERLTGTAAGVAEPVAAPRHEAPQPSRHGGRMIRKALMCAVVATVALTNAAAQTIHTVPRPPAPAPGPPKPEDGSAAPDGYAPLPAWLGQTRAPRAATRAADDVETGAEGLTAAFCFSFLPDGRIIVGERPGRIKIVGKDGKISEPLAGMPSDLWARGQGLFEVRPDRAFASNRRLFL